MSYLKRRISFLIEQFENKSLLLPDDFVQTENGKQLVEDLAAIKKLPDGTVDISSCTPLVRVVAKSIYSFDRMLDREKETPQAPTRSITPELIAQSMKDYFQLLDNFFLEATGTPANKFAANEAFDDRIRRDGKKISNSMRSAYEEYLPKIAKFHGENSEILLGAAKAIGGLRCVLGGASRFPEPAFDGLRKFALYADTIFLPDPVLPWIEQPRNEERFPIVLLLEQTHNLLKLKPLMDAQLPYPAVVVFPSWEKSLEGSDEETQDEISEMILGFFSFFLKATFEDEKEIIDYICRSGKKAFRQVVENQGLFWAPEASSPQPFDQALEQYQNQLRIWRSEEWLERFDPLPPEFKVFNGICERLSPQFHIQDNAQTLKAQPLFWSEPHFHYFRLLSQVNNSSFQEAGFLKPQTSNALQSLLNPGLAWLGNVPIDILARFREENLNEDFRRKLESSFNELSNATIDEIDNVTAEVIRSISVLLSEHEKEARKIADQYEKKHVSTLAAVSILTLGVAFSPWLTPFLGASVSLAPLLAKYSRDTVHRAMDRKTLARSLTGILSDAKRKSND